MTRRRRRATRPATGGVPQRGGRPEQSRDDVEAESREASARAAAYDAAEDDTARWLREQRPPHWE